MENCRRWRVLAEKSIDKPMGAYYNVLAVISRCSAAGGSSSLRLSPCVAAPREWQSHSPKPVHTIGRASFGLCIRAPPVADTARRQRRSGRNAAKRTASLRISGTASWGLYRPDGQHRPTQRAPLTASTILYRDVAQFGSALRSGRRGRRFESCHLDQQKSHPQSWVAFPLVVMFGDDEPRKCVSIFLGFALVHTATSTFNGSFFL